MLAMLLAIGMCPRYNPQWVFTIAAQNTEIVLAICWPSLGQKTLYTPHRGAWPTIWFQSVLYKNNIGTRLLAIPGHAPQKNKGVPQPSVTMSRPANL